MTAPRMLRGLMAAAGDGTITYRPLDASTRLVLTGYSVLDVNGTKAYAGIQVRTTG